MKALSPLLCLYWQLCQSGATVGLRGHGAWTPDGLRLGSTEGPVARRPMSDALPRIPRDARARGRGRGRDTGPDGDDGWDLLRSRSGLEAWGRPSGGATRVIGARGNKATRRVDCRSAMDWLGAEQSYPLVAMMMMGAPDCCNFSLMFAGRASPKDTLYFF